MVYLNAISYHLSENKVTNQDIIEDYLPYVKKMDKKIYDAQKLFDEFGINMRYEADLKTTARDLGVIAAKKLFKEWNIDKSTIEYIIFVSDCFDYKGPTSACLMQHDLGLSQSIGAIDILHGCAGYIYGLSVGKALIDSGLVNNVLLITADTPTKTVHPSDPDLRAIFSDGAAASLLSRQKPENNLNAEISQHFVFGTDGSHEHDLKAIHSGSRNPASIEWLKAHADAKHGNLNGRMQMNKSAVFLFSVKTVPKMIDQLLQKENQAQDNIDLFVFHQANAQMIDFIRKRMKIPEDKFIINIKETGNTVSASIPIALYLSYKAGKIKSNYRTLLAGFGIGFSWGATTIKFT